VPTSGGDERDAGREYDVVAVDNGVPISARGHALGVPQIGSGAARRLSHPVFTRRESAAK
jgi:hypothetical protein